MYPSVLKRFSIGLAATAFGFVGMCAFFAPAYADTVNAGVAKLGWLDKITARVGEIEVRVGEKLALGTLDIEVKSCIRRVPPDSPESASFMVIEEREDGQPNAIIFQGWMFASSPSLSAMDHGVYDVWVLECAVSKAQEKGSVQPAPDQLRPTTIEPRADGEIVD